MTDAGILPTAAARSAPVVETRRYAALDALRGLAALSVVVGHQTAGRFGFAAHYVAFYLAVDFFFVLSGFVLAYRYWDPLASGRQSFLPVVAARVARLYPAHVFVLLMLLLAFGGEAIPAIVKGTPVLGAWRDAIPDWPGGGKVYTFVLNLFLAHNIGLTPSGLTWNVPSWSVSVEFFGSLAVLALAAFWRGRGRTLVLIALVVGGYALVFAIKGHLDATYETLWKAVNLGLVRCIAGVAAGTLCFLAMRRYLQPCSVGLATATTLEACTVAAVLALVIRADYHSASDVLFPLAALVLVAVFALQAGLLSGLLRAPLPVYVGRLSYAIYLVHWPLLFIMIEQYALPPLWFYLAVLGAAAFTHHAVEIPARRLLVGRLVPRHH